LLKRNLFPMATSIRRKVAQRRSWLLHWKQVVYFCLCATEVIAATLHTWACFQMEDILIFLETGSWPQFFENGRRPQSFSMEDDIIFYKLNKTSFFSKRKTTSIYSTAQLLLGNLTCPTPQPKIYWHNLE
jgi:hypothetical protein